VDKVVLDDCDASVRCGDHVITAARVVMCTNGFNHHRIENRAGGSIGEALTSNVDPVVGYMAGFLGPPGAKPDATSYVRNAEIGGALPYYYSTRHPYRLGAASSTLVCLGGPEARADGRAPYDPDSELPESVIRTFDEEVCPVAAPDHSGHGEYDFTWHGLMGYTRDKVRLVGFEPRNRHLMYNMGCNGVGFLPSIAGGMRIARLHRGVALEPSIFDPR
jgi:glycine/D-amino acid oxidase-like deaminating enzyme